MEWLEPIGMSHDIVRIDAGPAEDALENHGYGQRPSGAPRTKQGRTGPGAERLAMEQRVARGKQQQQSEQERDWRHVQKAVHEGLEDPLMQMLLDEIGDGTIDVCH